MESDIIPLYFTSTDKEGTIKNWVFDTRHTKPSLGNELVSGTPPIAETMPLGNYGVTTRYTIEILNATNVAKEITYVLRGNYHAIVKHKEDNGNWEANIKTLVEDYDCEKETWNEFYARTRAEMFSITLEPYEHKILTFETILPNADKGGVNNSLIVSSK